MLIEDSLTDGDPSPNDWKNKSKDWKLGNVKKKAILTLTESHKQKESIALLIGTLQT